MKSSKIIVAAAFIISAAYFLTNSQREESLSDAPTTSNEAPKVQQDSSPGKSDTQDKVTERQEDQRRKDEKEQASQSPGPGQEQLSLSTLDEFNEIPREHKESLITQTQVMKNFAKRQTRSDALVDHLRKLETKPLVMNDDNPYTGSMKVVRTRSPIPGTRYFHAQYFDNEEGDEYVQHMSFEFRPGEQSFEAVKKSIQTAYNLGEPLEDKQNFISWKQGKDYIVWIKKMDLKDMQDDPFNAYSKEDVGTIRVAKELEIHDQAPSFHMQQGPGDSQEP